MSHYDLQRETIAVAVQLPVRKGRTLTDIMTILTGQTGESSAPHAFEVGNGQSGERRAVKRSGPASQSVCPVSRYRGVDCTPGERVGDSIGRTATPARVNQTAVNDSPGRFVASAPALATTGGVPVASDHPVALAVATGDDPVGVADA